MEDKVEGTAIHFKSVSTSAWFMVFFAVTSAMASWDWIMSIDPHWFSTIFGWYVFAEWGAIGFTTILLFTLLPIGSSGEFPWSLVHFKLTGDGIDARFLTEKFILKSKSLSTFVLSDLIIRNSGVIYLYFKSKLILFLKTIDNLR